MNDIFGASRSMWNKISFSFSCFWGLNCLPSTVYVSPQLSRGRPLKMFDDGRRWHRLKLGDLFMGAFAAIDCQFLWQVRLCRTATKAKICSLDDSLSPSTLPSGLCYAVPVSKQICGRICQILSSCHTGWCHRSPLARLLRQFMFIRPCVVYMILQSVSFYVA